MCVRDRLSEDQTRRIFETNTIDSEENVDGVVDSAASSTGAQRAQLLRLMTLLKQ